MNIVIVGHVDHGKSTVIGRLMADTDSLPDGKLEQVKRDCELNSKPFEYAFLLDALHDEQDQGITIDSARVFFKTALRDYIIIDAPGHIEFLKNMISGAARAEAALLVIDADEGVQENSRRHGYMLSMLGIKQVVVLVNKMDLVAYDQKTFEAIVTEFTGFLSEIGLNPRAFIPVSGREGDNIASQADTMPWFNDGSVLSHLDEFEKQKPESDKPFRMPVQGVYKFTQNQDSRRIVAGTVESGTLHVGDEISFFPSGKRSRVKSLESFNTDNLSALMPGEAVGFTLEEQIFITRGEIAARSDEQACEVSSRIRSSLFWLGRSPLKHGQELLLKLGTTRVEARLEKIHKVLDASNLGQSERDTVQRHEIAECEFKLKRPLAFDIAGKYAGTSRFVLVDNFEIQGGGIILDAVEDRQKPFRTRVQIRNQNWEYSGIPMEKRAMRYSQKPTLVFISGDRQTGKKTLARHLESELFHEGKHVYFIGIGNVLYGLDSDIKEPNESAEKKAVNQQEHMRRMAEVAHLMMDAGLLVIVTATNLTETDLNTIRTGLLGDRHPVLTVWLGEPGGEGSASPDLLLPAQGDLDFAVDEIRGLLRQQGAIFDPHFGTD